MKFRCIPSLLNVTFSWPAIRSWAQSYRILCPFSLQHYFSLIFVTKNYASSRNPVHMLSIVFRFLCLPPFAFTYIQFHPNIHYGSGYLLYKSVLAPVPSYALGWEYHFPVPFWFCSDTASSLSLFLYISQM